MSEIDGSLNEKFHRPEAGGRMFFSFVLSKIHLINIYKQAVHPSLLYLALYFTLCTHPAYNKHFVFPIFLFRMDVKQHHLVYRSAV